eukprot:TRINITY_DN49884_c0_g1_i1.p1 TRINITY_DN49884_c0_g1~~TRINITY_DN49884_c0_g1_i1.p1  ORF type:complete len:441 (-),score=19.48 TRINITY_DN49884_c0_g1_i1:177-1499(-)
MLIGHSAEALLYRRSAYRGLCCLFVLLALFDLGVGFIKWIGHCRTGNRNLSVLKQIFIERAGRLYDKFRCVPVIWYLAFLCFMEALMRFALRRSWFFLYRCIQNALFVIKTTRPEFLCLWLFPYLEGKALRCHVLQICTWEQHDIINMFMLALPFTFWTYGINDYYDRAGDLLNPMRDHKRFKVGPFKLMDGFKLDISKYKEYEHIYIWSRDCSLLLCSVWAAYYIVMFPEGTVNALIIAWLVFVTWAYSAPPLRLKEVPVLDLVCNLSYALCLILGISYPSQLARVSPGGAAVAAAAFANTCIYTFCGEIVGQLKDYTSDKQAGYKTFVVAYGSVGLSALVFIIASLHLGTRYLVLTELVHNHYQERMRKDMMYLVASGMLLCVETLTSQRLFRLYLSIPEDLRSKAILLGLVYVYTFMYYITVLGRIVDLMVFWSRSQ